MSNVEAVKATIRMIVSNHIKISQDAPDSSYYGASAGSAWDAWYSEEIKLQQSELVPELALDNSDDVYYKLFQR